jgi:hypothetical protein
VRKKRKRKGFRLKDALDQHRDVGDWLRRQIFDRDKWKCQLCGDAVTPENATIDHVVPISKGGSLNDPKNLRTAHEVCNRMRGDGEGQIETMVFGWAWQFWSENTYPGPDWQFWMKVCPRCFRGPLTRKPDDADELCRECEYDYRELMNRRIFHFAASEAVEALDEKNKRMLYADAGRCRCPDELGNMINDLCPVHGGKLDGGPAT